MRPRKKRETRVQLICQMFGRKGAPYLSFISTVFSLFGGFLMAFRPVIFSSGRFNGFQNRWTYGQSSGSLLSGPLGEGGSTAVMVGLIFLGLGIFLFLVSYRVTKEKEEER